MPKNHSSGELFVKDQHGKYKLSRPATESEIIAAAAVFLEARLVGKELTTPAAARDFLRVRLS
ncbi:MAG: hypothetical protein K2Q23_14160, partial [Bryobacteraceae bacterium]|nr:hypothetical protein [Bryobacteraceae bacterium]